MRRWTIDDLTPEQKIMVADVIIEGISKAISFNGKNIRWYQFMNHWAETIRWRAADEINARDYTENPTKTNEFNNLMTWIDDE